MQAIVLANKWPKPWWNHYLRNNFLEHDQVIKECLRNDAIIQWDENTPDYQGQSDDLEKVHQIRADADEFGLRRGFVVPIHRAQGFCGAVSYVGMDIEIGDRDKPLLHLISIYAFEHLYKLSELEPVHINVLTPREKEVTQWAAKGKTTEQIANLIAITPRTVIMHLQNAARKLGASNRTHLVARALQLGHIEF